MRQTRAHWICKPSNFFFWGFPSLSRSLLLLSLSCIAFAHGTFSDIARGATCRNYFHGRDSELSGFFIDFRLRDGRTSIDYIPPVWGLPFSFVDFRLRDGRTSINYHQCGAFRFFFVDFRLRDGRTSNVHQLPPVWGSLRLAPINPIRCCWQ